MDLILAELGDLRKDGYVSDSDFVDTSEGPSSDMSNIIFVDNLPSAPAAMAPKLVAFGRDKIFAKIGEVSADGFVIPMKEDGSSTQGFGFVTYKSREVAQAAVAALDGKAFDAKHTMRVVRLDELMSMEEDPRASVQPARLIQTPSHVDDFYWLHDEQCRDEFLIRYSLTDSSAKIDKQGNPQEDKHETEVLWSDMRGAPSLDYGGESQKLGRRNGRPTCWADGYVSWSPRGTYLTTMHEQGAKLWHGKGFRSEGWEAAVGGVEVGGASTSSSSSFRLDHAKVREVLWSPNERYVGTWSGYAGNPRPERAFVIWDVFCGVEVRKFKQMDITDDRHGFAWSPDSKYLARVVTEVSPDGRSVLELIHVYEAATGFRLLEDRSIKASGARDLAWSPGGSARNQSQQQQQQCLLSWWSMEHDNVPMTVSVMKIPSKEYAKQRPLINLQDTRIVWHPEGEYAAVFAEKLTKVALAKKRAEASRRAGVKGASVEAPAKGVGGGASLEESQCGGYQLEVYRLKAKDVPIESLEIKDRIVDMAWEPNSLRFALLTESTEVVKEEEETGDSRFPTRIRARIVKRHHVAFYTLGDKVGDIQHLFTWTGNFAPTGLHWSPRGDTIIFSQLASPSSLPNSGRCVFYDVERRKVVADVTHDDANGLAWDPSGRQVATFKARNIEKVFHSRDTVTNGYCLWTFQGVKVHSAEKPKLFQFLWRPRVEGLLSEEEQKAVVKELRKHIQRYQDEDKSKAHRKQLLARLRKRKARDEFRAFMSERATEWEESMVVREALNLVPYGYEANERDEEVVTSVEVLLSETVTLVAKQ